MANPSAPNPNASGPAPTQEVFDELSGVYGFFRRHQKKILYTAGLFTLLTFSIAQQLQDSVRNVAVGTSVRGTIEVNGKSVEVLEEDIEMGRRVSMAMTPRNSNMPALPSKGDFRQTPSGGFAVQWFSPVLPQIGGGDSEAEPDTVYGLLRRAAIVEGMELPYGEADQAIASYLKVAGESGMLQSSPKTPEQLAVAVGMPSLAAYRQVVAEALRIGAYIKLQTLGLDVSDANVLQLLLADKEKLAFRVASFDEKKLKNDLQNASKLTEEDLRKWFDGKADREKQGMQAYDLPRAKLHFAAALLADGQFSAEQWQADLLKDFTITDDQLRNYYEQEKDARYKLENGEFKPFDDAAVKTELTRLVQAEHVMNQLLNSVRAKQVTHLEAATNEMTRTQTELATFQTTVSELTAAKATKEAEADAKEKELAGKPDDAELKAALATLQAAVAKAAEDVARAETDLQAKKAAVTAAETALKAQRESFDLPTVFKDLVKDKQGFEVRSMTEMKNGEQLVDLDACGVALGKWPLAGKFMTLQNKGDLGSVVGRAKNGVFLLQAIEIDSKPLKAWEQLKPLVEGAYFTEEAKKQAEEKRKAMEAALLRLAKEKLKDKVAEIEGKKQARIDEKVAAWEKQLTEDVASAEAMLAKPGLGQLPRRDFEAKRDSSKRRLEGKVEQTKAFENEVTKLIEREIADEAKKVYGDVLDAAAAEAGFTVADWGPFPRELSQRPRFQKAFDPTIVYLWQTQSKAKKGDATGLLQDFANGRYHVAVCTQVAPLEPQDLTRREFEALRQSEEDGFARLMESGAFAQAFTIEAVGRRYGWKPSVGEQIVEKPADKPAEKPADKPAEKPADKPADGPK